FVVDAAAAEVVAGASAGRGVGRGEGLGAEGVGEPVVAGEPGGNDLLLPRRPGDGGCGGVALAAFRVGVAVRVVAELAEHPGAGPHAHARSPACTWRARVPRLVPSETWVRRLGDTGPDGFDIHPAAADASQRPRQRCVVAANAFRHLVPS